MTKVRVETCGSFDKGQHQTAPRHVALFALFRWPWWSTYQVVNDCGTFFELIFRAWLGKFKAPGKLMWTTNRTCATLVPGRLSDRIAKIVPNITILRDIELAGKLWCLCSLSHGRASFNVWHSNMPSARTHMHAQNKIEVSRRNIRQVPIHTPRIDVPGRSAKAHPFQKHFPLAQSLFCFGLSAFPHGWKSYRVLKMPPATSFPSY